MKVKRAFRGALYMKYYFIDTLGNLDDEWCLLDAPPEDMGLAYYMPAEGERVGDEYPSDAKIYMSEEYPGIKLGSLIGHTESYLIVSRAVKEVIEAHCMDVEIEYLPFTLYNHKKRVHSREYFIINPIGTIDCLNLDASEIEYFEEEGDPYDGAVVDVDKFVLDRKKLEGAPALFRIREDPGEYVINEKLARAFRERGFTNIQLDKIEQK
jgi:hypothetical protein